MLGFQNIMNINTFITFSYYSYNNNNNKRNKIQYLSDHDGKTNEIIHFTSHLILLKYT